MPTQWINKIADMPLERLFIAAVMVAVGGLLVAMYIVCEAQARQGDERRADLRARRAAVMDCMVVRPRASYADCEQVVAGYWDAPSFPPGDARAASTHRVTTLVPVAFNAYR